MSRDNVAQKNITESWLQALLLTATHFRVPVSEENARVNFSYSSGAQHKSELERLSNNFALSLEWKKVTADILNPWYLPLIIKLPDNAAVYVENISNDGTVKIVFCGLNSTTNQLPIKKFLELIKGCEAVVARPKRNIADARVDDYIKPYKKNWFWSIVLRDSKYFISVLLAALLANVLALSSILFSMQVYDRVIPGKSIPTLAVLFIGVIIAMVFEFTMRIVRVRLIDLIGKRADLKITDTVFGHALRIRMKDRVRSTGTFVSQLRELENVRETITSTTVTAASDLPFFLLFLFIMWLIAGSLAFIPLVALFVMILPGILLQPRLARLANEAMRESSLRNASLIEAVQCNEDIKFNRAEPRFQQEWNFLNEKVGDTNLEVKFITQALMTWSQTVQTLVFAVTILVGSFLVMDGDITTGVLLGASILSSRMMAPMAQVSALLARWQSTKVSLKSLNELMEKPVDSEFGKKLIHKPTINGHFVLDKVAVTYDVKKPPILGIKYLEIKPNEKIALLGRNGSGKSTLLYTLSGLLDPVTGQIKLDDVNLAAIDPYDVRRDIGYVGSNSRLIHGTLRDNMTLGKPDATDSQIVQALTLAGAGELVKRSSDGLNLILWEGGIGLSGGQRQAVLLARTFLTQSKILLLDEPTSALDEIAEHQLISNLKNWVADKTLIVATHKTSVLSLVDRIIVLNNGQIVLDGPRDDILKKLIGDNPSSTPVGV
ncbi:type I secretion system permease/ATPase [Pseudomonas sp. F1_0610]|uniref:type I secretion system permease/ATPase n=1 Tax=Pseudomonas sp. F1_0610 TaxID=3114284 RepID=UPI0039C3B3E3